MTARLIIGDALTVLRTLPDQSVDLVLTSSPFHRQRKYSGDEREIGLEATPGEFIDALLDVVEAAAPKLAGHGSLVWELGDTMAGSGGSGGDYDEGGLREGQTRIGSAWRGEGDGFPLHKSHELIPELFRIALAYGVNPLTGRQTPKWRIRNVRPWVRTSPPVGALFDSFRSAHSSMVVACQSRRRWFDLDAVRTSPKEGFVLEGRTVPLQRNGIPGQPDHLMNPLVDGGRVNSNPAGAPPLDWFVHNPKGYPGAHYATWDEDMLVETIEAMCPRRVCLTCGRPACRITRRKSSNQRHRRNRTELGQAHDAVATTDVADVAEFETVGWSCCGCGPACKPTVETGQREQGWRWALGPWGSKNQGVVEPGSCDGSHWRPGLVLDPFAGTFTTGAVAVGHGRDAIGVDLDPRNADLARERVGMWLEVEHHVAEPVATVDD